MQDASPPDLLEKSSLERLFGRWRNAGGVVLAVSGGPDSMALLHMAARWALANDAPPMFAATVDHGLRKEAKSEARLAANAAKKLGIAHKILPWRGQKPLTRIQESARSARYDLLAAHARNVGADVLMTAHHADDQAETILFRLMRGSGVSGLAGMRADAGASAAMGGVRLARPLLELSKQDLIEVCVRQGQIFAEDPSNNDSRYARTGLRALLKVLETHGLGAQDWVRLGARLARVEDALAAKAREAASLSPLTPGVGASSFLFLQLAAEPEEISRRVLALHLAQAGAATPLRLDRLENLNERLRDAAFGRKGLTATLGGMKLRLDRAGWLQIAPEPPRRRGRA